MSFLKLMPAILLVAFAASCVQKSSKKTVVVRLNTSAVENIESVGLRGEGRPLSWNSDLELQPLVKDSLYSATFSLVTGYKFLEAKFTINGKFELEDLPNRKINFSNGDTTYYNAIFNQIKE